MDGVVRLRERQFPGLDVAQIRDEAQHAGEELRARIQDWDALGRTADEVSPWSFRAAR